MNNLEIDQQLKHLIAEVKEKVEEGRDGLYTAEHLPEKRHVGLKSALISYHGALEDYFRASLVTKVPVSEREAVLDTEVTKWKDLLQLAKEHLFLSHSDADLIYEANVNRNKKSGHGNRFAWQETKLRQYTSLVERWCQKGIELLDGQVTFIVTNTGSSSTTGYQSSTSTGPYKPHTQVNETTQRPYVVSEPTPWYRSLWFLWLMFLFVNPIWALLIITEKDGNGCLKVIAWFFLLIYVAYFFAVGYFRDTYLSPEAAINSHESVSIAYTETMGPDYSKTNSQDTPEPVITTSTSSGTCEILWEEYRESDLSNMNRSMVWEEIVYQRVRGSGMTAREFYDLVVNQNSSLAGDGYVFKRDKIYLLPRCK